MEQKVSEGAIFKVNKGRAFAVTIKFRNDTVYLGNKDNDVKYFLDRWEIVK
jgi:hypothetical protein